MLEDKEDKEPFVFAQKYRLLFGEGKPLNLLTLTQGSVILSGIQSPADNWRIGMVCVVVVVCPFRNIKRSFWASAKGSTSSLYSNVLCLLFCVFLTGFCFYEGFVIQQKTDLDTNRFDM